MARNVRTVKRVILTWLESHGGKAPKDQGQFTEAMYMLFKSLEPHGVTREDFEDGQTRKDVIEACFDRRHKNWKVWKETVEKKFDRACIHLWPEDIVTEIADGEFSGVKKAVIKTEAMPEEEKPKRRSKTVYTEESSVKMLDRSKLEPTGIELPSDEDWEKEFLGSSK